jgi:hypothetical protein
MSRVVIYGEYPPTAGPAAEATLAAVRGRLAGGEAVEVVSPRPSAAHHHADLSTLAGAARLARLSAGAELELTLDPTLLVDRGRRGAPAQVALAAAVAGARRATVHVGPLGPPTGRGLVRLVLGRADAVVAASEADAEALQRAGIAGSRLSVRPPATTAAGSAAAGNGAPALPETPVRQRAPWSLGDEPGREELEAAVRQRAAEDRDEAAGNSAASTWPLHVLVPFAPPTPDSGKPAFASVKKVMWRLIAWAVLPLAEHVNHLQQATIESIDRHAGLADHSGDRRVKISS